MGFESGTLPSAYSYKREKCHFNYYSFARNIVFIHLGNYIQMVSSRGGERVKSMSRKIIIFKDAAKSFIAQWHCLVSL